MSAPFKFTKAHDADGYDILCRECDREIGYTVERPRVPKGYTGRWIVAREDARASVTTRREAGAFVYSDHLCEGLR